ncbi:5-(carboxyamino)imidazole ribonucleotide mutase [Herbivorax sp. ANBcel31]|uniref:AIR carboxylase family protein n=1 Tax=Herbivorax sp. ANBcel31 TaxID=3069754 RepID=UPI0027B0BF25|nr:AIR carboxylase family protein [Herbivorax sp. ANBcel31]MDQ2087373.1 5-(carboxyamino)imidazole ribonucleotide mutase [Herbivorax sp. ANBcel31]
MAEIKAAKAAIVTDTDTEILKDCIELLNQFGVEVVVNSDSDILKNTVEYVKNAEADGVGVIVAGYKKGSNLAEVLAKVTNIPVIGVPIKLKEDKGLDLLLPMTEGLESAPVATLAVNGFKNAGLLCVQILSTKYGELREKMKNYKSDLKQMVEKKDKNLKEQFNCN